jgi:hypothetical protein
MTACQQCFRMRAALQYRRELFCCNNVRFILALRFQFIHVFARHLVFALQHPSTNQMAIAPFSLYVT